MGPKVEVRIGLALLLVFAVVVVIAPLVGCFGFSPFLVAWGIQPYPLAAALGVMAAEAVAIVSLLSLVLRRRN